MSDDKPQSPKRTSGLLGDLESIRALLGEAEHDPRPGGKAPGAEAEPDTGSGSEGSGEDDVPLLEDVVRGGVSVNETFLSGQGDFQDSDEASGLNEEVFKALLSDEWRESARELLDQARQAIEQHQTEWTPAHTDELNEALKVRIDETLQQWIRQTLASRADELRRTLLSALSEQIRLTIGEQFNQTSPDEDPDGE